jgi:hypothetical protein
VTKSKNKLEKLPNEKIHNCDLHQLLLAFSNKKRMEHASRKGKAINAFKISIGYPERNRSFP